MESVSGVGVLDKAVVVMQAVAESPVSLVELQARTGLPRATLHRLAGALEHHGLLRRDEAGRYELGLGLVALGQAAAERHPLVEVARTALGHLNAETGESVQFFVREGAQRRCVVSLESPHGLRWIVPQGSLLPLDVGSAGRVLSGEVSKHGWVQSIGEREAGVASVSAPVAAVDGSTIAAVSVSGPIERLTRQPGKRFGDAVVAAATRISTALR
jgi:DNA-binding IclR family transcriptional regulator